MQHRRLVAIGVGVILLASCDDIGQPDRDATSDHPQLAVHVNSPSEIKSALRAGKTWIIVDNPIVFYSAADRIVIDDECALAAQAGTHCSNTITIESSGGWEGAFYRRASFSEPLIEARHTKDWEFRLKGLFFYGEYNSGPALNLEYAQSSILEDIHFVAFNGAPFILGCHWTNYPANCSGAGATAVTEFRDIALQYNNGFGELLNAGSLKVRNFTHQRAWNIGWGAGLRIVGGVRASNSIPGPVLIENSYVNGGEIRIEGTDKLTVRGGYYYSATTLISNSSVAVPTAFNQCDGVYAAGSQLKINGNLICY